MPKNKGKGGKNRRRGKNENEFEKRELIFKEDQQEYAQVTKMLGNGRLEAMCFDGVKRLCHIRGKLRKKVIVFSIQSNSSKKRKIVLFAWKWIIEIEILFLQMFFMNVCFDGLCVYVLAGASVFPIYTMCVCVKWKWPIVCVFILMTATIANYNSRAYTIFFTSSSFNLLSSGWMLLKWQGHKGMCKVSS